MTNKKLTPELQQLVLALSQKETIPSIIRTLKEAHGVGITYQSISAFLTKKGTVPLLKIKQTKLTPEQVAEITALRQQSVSLEEIVARTGQKMSTVRWALAKAGVKVTKEGHKANMRVGHVERVGEILFGYGVTTWDERMHQTAEEKSAKFLNHVERNRDRAEFECVNGHFFSAKVSNILAGTWCPHCDNMPALTLEEVRKIFGRGAVEVVSDSYGGVDAPLDVKCFAKHPYKTTLSDYRDGHGCPVCAGNFPHTVETIRALGASLGWILKSTEYLGIAKNLVWVCPSGQHEVEKAPGNLKASGCRKCSAGNHRSKEELEIEAFLVGLGYSPGTSDRTLIAPFELDIVLENEKLAIEHCGLWCHGQKVKKEKARDCHLNKLKACEAKGYRLITIFSDEWKYRQPQCEAFIKSVLGKRERQIGARECEVREVPVDAARAFLDQNHVMGGAGGTSQGLFVGDELVALTTFRESSPDRKGTPQPGYWELSRYCTKMGLGVSGGLGKLMAHFAKANDVKVIRSFSDKRWSQGGIYRKLGFTLEATVPPSYWYFKKSSDGPREHKFRYRRRKLMKLLKKTVDDGATEWEMAREAKLDWIWDCGLDRWIWVAK